MPKTRDAPWRVAAPEPAVHTVDRPRAPAAVNVGPSREVPAEWRSARSDDGRVEFTGCLHGAEGDVEDAAAAGPRVPRLAEARQQSGGDNRSLGRE